MLSVVRVALVATVILFKNVAVARDLNILILQETYPVECEITEHPGVDGVFQFNQDGERIPAKGGGAWNDCDNGSFLLPFGKQLIDSGMASSVTFMPVGLRGSSVKDWATGGAAYGKLQSALKVANRRQIKFDYVLWQGGIVDYKLEFGKYHESIAKALKSVKLNTRAQKFIILKSITCRDLAHPPEIPYQWNPLQNRFDGPNLSGLGAEYYADRCSLNASGNRKMAQLWKQAIDNAEIEGERFQRESLIYYFKRISR